MKILFVSPVGAMFSGAEVSIVNLMKLLVQEGHEVYNVIPDNTPHIDKEYLRHMDTTGIKLFQLKTNQWWWPESKTLDISDLEIQASQQKNPIIAVLPSGLLDQLPSALNSSLFSLLQVHC